MLHCVKLHPTRRPGHQLGKVAGHPSFGGSRRCASTPTGGLFKGELHERNF